MRAPTIALIAAVSVGVVSTARAEPPDPQLPPPTWSYLYDGGAIAFGYVPLAILLGTRAFLEPPKSPRLFSPDEGGATFNGDTVPEASLAATGLLAGGVIMLSSSDARWHHSKGYSLSVVSTLGLTEVAKNVFGRHRPHWENNDVADDRRSFFSGHSSATWQSATYLGLYLNGHVFSQWRRAGSRYAWWEAFPHGALLASSVFVSWSRIDDNRHHLSDVITGALVGTGLATAFYIWQERRYRRAKRKLRRLRELSATQPTTDP